MNCRKSIFKFLGIAAVCAASAACSVDDADDLALVKLGALKKEFVVEADANTFDIDIYANSAFHIERINQADWISLTCGETEDGKGAITAECEFNEGFKRKAGFVLCSDVDARRAAGERTLAILKETYNVSGFLAHFEEGERA